MANKRKLNKEQLQLMQFRYEAGATFVELSDEFKVTRQGAYFLAKKHCWQQNKIKDKMDVIKEKINEIAQETPTSHQIAVSEQLKKDVENAFDFVKAVKHLDKGAIALHNMLLHNIIDSFKSGKLSNVEASNVLKNLGLNVDKVAGRAGMNKEPSTSVNIPLQINNLTSIKSTAVAQCDNQLDAAKAYADMIKAGKS